jgi:hypothetical protein
MDIIPESTLGESITIIGAGAVGSWTAKALARMGMSNIVIYDHDKVDEVNMNSQGYKVADIGQMKVNALFDSIKEETGIEIHIEPKRYEGGTFPGIVISAVDNMSTRALIWQWHKDSPATLAVIDPRMGAENASLFVAKPGDENYPKSLFKDSEGMHEPCTAKATIYTAYLLSGLIVKAVKDLITKKDQYLSAVNWDIGANDVMMHQKPRGGADEKEVRAS